MSDLYQPTRYFRGLQQGAFMRLEHAASLKGLLKPFKGKGDLVQSDGDTPDHINFI